MSENETLAIIICLAFVIITAIIAGAILYYRWIQHTELVFWQDKQDERK